MQFQMRVIIHFGQEGVWGVGDTLGGYVDLLTQPMNERLLEQMLAGEWQVCH